MSDALPVSNSVKGFEMKGPRLMITTINISYFYKYESSLHSHVEARTDDDNSEQFITLMIIVIVVIVINDRDDDNSDQST